MSIQSITLNEFATEFSLNLVYAIVNKYNISIETVFNFFDSINYWKLLNDDKICGVIAHDGLKETINNLEDKLNAYISWNR